MTHQENVFSQNSRIPFQYQGRGLHPLLAGSAKQSEKSRSKSQSRKKNEGQHNPESKNPPPEKSGE